VKLVEVSVEEDEAAAITKLQNGARFEVPMLEDEEIFL
jgi:hypothetical protein